MTRPYANRVQLSVRLDRQDKDFLTQETERCGLEPSVAARQVMELLCQRMRAGADYMEAIVELRNAWKAPTKGKQR